MRVITLSRFLLSFLSACGCLCALLSCFGFSLTERGRADLFFPLTAGTTWVYRGTVEFWDPETDKSVSTDVEIKTTVQKVIQQPEFTAAFLSGMPSDLDWATGSVQPKPWMLIETRTHEVYLEELPPDFDYTKFEKDPATLKKFLVVDSLLFRWPMKIGMKFGDAESTQRQDHRYCWYVAEHSSKVFKEAGQKARPVEAFQLQYVSNPEDTQFELSPGIGILRYEYHHHGSVANTTLSLVEFHPAPGEKADHSAGVKP